MIYQTYLPQSLLSQFIEFFWMREGEHLSAVQTRLLPMGMMELVINLHEDSIPLFDRQSRVQRGSTNGTMLCGTHSENFIAQVDRKISVMGVHFRPGGGTAFFGLPAGELHNENISLDELWQGHAAELRDRLLKTSLKNRFSVLERFLMQMLRSPALHPAVDFAVQQFQRSTLPTVRAVTDQIGFSTRHFNQLFRDQVGLTPKLFCRIQRFQQVLNLLALKNQVNWMDIVFTCGYFDQAHLIHEFRAFADCTPTEYLSRRGFHPCHVELPH
ncbi:MULTISPECIES: helix-turn-helix domain-containing protein [Brasilonema]|nr:MULTISPECIES: AraC family transcriptional regulator [Brasilonema]